MALIISHGELAVNTEPGWSEPAYQGSVQVGSTWADNSQVAHGQSHTWLCIW